ncbi:alpha-N-acetylgalactosamine-specific lectin-like [Patiria miniata]|uniref:C-type lectin domain-containing protein n=1 Tax=Patiria miniata TaxID=46514 RepID=A0A914AQJ8_PATMI|nr:alpha-N-acetylgalactosamine-specific lectin-like [Patiria miniata]
MVGLGVDIAAACQPQCPKCPPMRTFYNGNCYRLFGIGKTYDEAEKHCQQFTQVGQGHLASIASAGENNLLLTLWKSARGTTSGGLWIGFNDLAGEGNYIWTDRSAPSYTGWADDQPDNHSGNEHCVHMREDGDNAWNDIECGQSFSYLCKMTTTK